MDNIPYIRLIYTHPVRYCGAYYLYGQILFDICYDYDDNDDVRYAHTHTHTYIHTYIRTHSNTHRQNTHTHTYIHTYMHTQTKHTHTHTHTHVSSHYNTYFYFSFQPRTLYHFSVSFSLPCMIEISLNLTDI